MKKHHKLLSVLVVATIQLEQYRTAISYFNQIINDNQDQQTVSALFYAWQSAIALYDLDLAYRYFENVNGQQLFNSEQQIAAIPQYILRGLPRRYNNHARKLKKPTSLLQFHSTANQLPSVKSPIKRKTISTPSMA